MRKAFLPSLIVGLLALGALCGPAAAAPSSNSAVNEYTERLPDPGGGQSNGSHPGGGEKGSGMNPGGSGGGADSSPLPPDTARQLEAQGGDSGKNLSGIVEDTGSAASGSETGASSGGSGASSGGSAGNDDSESLLDSIGGTLSDFAGGSDTGLGAGFPILLAVVLLGAVGALVTRHRRREGPHADA